MAIHISEYQNIAASSRSVFGNRVVLRDGNLKSLSFWGRLVSYLGKSSVRKTENRTTHENFRKVLKDTYGEEITANVLKKLQNRISKNKGLRVSEMSRALTQADRIRKQDPQLVKATMNQVKDDYFDEVLSKLKDNRDINELPEFIYMTDSELVSIHRCANELSSLVDTPGESVDMDTPENYICQERLNTCLLSSDEGETDTVANSFIREAIFGLEKLPSVNQHFYYVHGNDSSVDFNAQLGNEHVLNQFNTLIGEHSYHNYTKTNNVVFEYIPTGSVCKDVSGFVGDGRNHYLIHPNATVKATSVVKNDVGGVLVTLNVFFNHDDS